MNKKFVLFINSMEDKPKVILFDIENEQKISESIVADKKQLSEQLLVKIEKMLTDSKLKKSDIAAIVADNNPGSYTGVRIGITTANFLAFSLNIPILSATEECFSKKDWQKIKDEIKVSDHFISPILPIYSSPPFITKKKI